MIITITPEIFKHKWGESFLKALQGNKDTDGDPLLGFNVDEYYCPFIVGLNRKLRPYRFYSSISFNTDNLEVDESCLIDYPVIMMGLRLLVGGILTDAIDEQEGIEIK